ncbi:hypothetical protein L6452_09038 [Arctium lappa]|uniref:Uncharacterized protein n=1 Tax=Arctium lappa TaxID=4217 RepID=A0ACB9DJF0_ARCLA|nr:hypothetical protein L6452_09038 [Arctium lappa]
MLDLVIRNEDRLPCRYLRWGGNSANLLLADKMATANRDALEEAFDSAISRYRPRVIRALQKERRSTSVDSRLSTGGPDIASKSSDTVLGSPVSGERTLTRQVTIDPIITDFNVVAIDSVVPRGTPAGKRAHDQENYPKLVELLINSSEYASHLLYEITIGKQGVPPEAVETPDNLPFKDMASVVHEFRSGFRATLMDLQGFHIFLLTLPQKLDFLLRAFMNIIDRTSCGDFDKEDLMLLDPSSHSSGGPHYLSPQGKEKERVVHDSQSDSNDSELQKTAPKVSSSGLKENLDSTSPMSRDASHGKSNKGSSEPLSTMCMTTKLRDFHKHAKVDAELNRELEQWNELLRNEALKLCQENNFNSGFFEGKENNVVVDAYELKLRLEHILERISLISDAGNTENPSSSITSITEAHQFIDAVEQKGGKVLVHCFEGRSRSATVVLAYLMMRKNFTLLKAWNTLRRAHRRVQPNDGFARILVELDRKLHGMASMEWQLKKPAMKVCPICGKNAGLSSSSLKLHLQKSHRKLSSGSVDSAMTMELQKVLEALNLTQRQSHSSD